MCLGLAGGIECLEEGTKVIAFVVSRPEHVNIQNILMMCTAQRNPYVVHREGGAQ